MNPTPGNSIELGALVGNRGRFGDQQNSHGRNSAPISFVFFSTNFCSLAFVRANSCNLGNRFINIGWYGGVKNRSVYIDEKIPPSDGQGVNIHLAFLAPPRSSSPPRAALWNGSEAKVSPSREMGQEQLFAGNGMKLGSSNLNRVDPLVKNPQDISRSEMDGKNSLQNWRFTVLLGLAHESSLTGVLFMKSSVPGLDSNWVS